MSDVSRTALNPYLQRHILWIRILGTSASQIEKQLFTDLSRFRHQGCGYRRTPRSKWYRCWKTTGALDDHPTSVVCRANSPPVSAPAPASASEEGVAVTNVSLSFPDYVSTAAALQIIRQSPIVASRIMNVSYFVPRRFRKRVASMASAHALRCDGLPSYAAPYDVVKHFQGVGEVFDVRLFERQENAATKTKTAYIWFVTSTAADNAHAILDGIPLAWDTQPLRVSRVGSVVELDESDREGDTDEDGYTDDTSTTTTDPTSFNAEDGDLANMTDGICASERDSLERELQRNEMIRLRTEVLSTCICPITLSVMKHPVVALDGYTYELDAISTWIEEHKVSPMNGMVMPPQFITNLNVHRVLRSLSDTQTPFEGTSDEMQQHQQHT